MTHLIYIYIYMTLEHKSSHKSLGYICSNSQKYIVWIKIIDLFLLPTIIRILRSCSMKIFSKCPTVNISKYNYWLLICIAKNLIWTTLKMIFSIFIFFLHPQIPDFQIAVSQPNIVQTIHQWKYYLFSFQMMYTSQILIIDPYDWFCVPGSHLIIVISWYIAISILFQLFVQLH